MEIVTITSKDGMTADREEMPEDANGIYPNGAKDADSRPMKFDGKRVIFFTSRVHPGETPGSHVLNGALDIISE